MLGDQHQLVAIAFHVPQRAGLTCSLIPGAAGDPADDPHATVKPRMPQLNGPSSQMEARPLHRGTRRRSAQVPSGAPCKPSSRRGS